MPIDFRESMVYVFENQLLHFIGGDPTKGTTLDTVPSLTVGQLRKIFLDDIQQFDNKGAQYKDSCISAEFGYQDLNSGISYTTENLVKAWHVKPMNSDYPEAIYQDPSGKRVYYSNGIETFH